MYELQDDIKRLDTAISDLDRLIPYMLAEHRAGARVKRERNVKILTSYQRMLANA